MKMKKMLAILAALSVLGTTGLTVGAEDTATTTEPATEASTTTETEAETTAAETTAETEAETETTATEETAVTEENQVVKMEDSSNEITIDGVSFTVKVSVASDSSVVLSVLKDGNVTNLNNICVESKVSGELQVSNYYSVNDRNGLVIYAVDGNHIYTWSETYNVFTACALLEEGEDGNTTITDASTFQMNGKTVKVVLYDENDGKSDELLQLSVYVDGKLTNLSGIVVNSGFQGMQGPGNYTDKDFYQYSVHQYFSVSGNVLTVKPIDSSYGETASYIFDDASGQFVTAGGAQTTTTTTTENTTTTTTTVDPAETEEALRKIFEEYVAEKQAADESGETGGIKSFYYDDTAKKAYGVYGGNGSMHRDVLCIITKDGVVEQTFIEETPGHMGSDSWSVKEAACFTCNGSTFVVEIVNLYSNGGNLYALNILDVNGNQPARTNLYRIYVGNTTKDQDGLLVTDPNSSIALDDYFTVKSDSVITVNGVDYTYDTASAQFVKVGDSDSGKTDNSSASNAPASTATKNTSGTPKTGDMTTVPAVTVGLTLTAAGVVAFISKRKK